MKASKYAMQTVGYYLLSQFKDKWDNGNSVMRLLEKEIGYEEYHNFWKCRLPITWYYEILGLLNLDKQDLLVEVARIKGNHAKDLHYHKISHAICIILGETTGFLKTPWDSAIQIDTEIKTAHENMECYFPTGCKHTFYGSTSDTAKTGDLYFLSIQSPPLLTEDNDDFYWVYGNR
jgi:hypothetical protein